jgi:hypothetical protein
VRRGRTNGLLLRVYPRRWRQRYGDELAALILESAGGGPVSWRTRVDVALGGIRERLRSAGLAGDHGSPGDRMRAGGLVVLCAWALFVVPGIGVAKFAEHWQQSTPADARLLPAGAFMALIIAAAAGTVFVLAGVATALPSLVAFLRRGGWPAIRGPVIVAALLTLAVLAALGGLVGWARALSVQQRNGSDLAYSLGFVATGLLVVACLGAWTAAAVAVARRLTLSSAVLRLDARLAPAVTVAMGLMTVATAVWWASVPGFGPAPQLAASTALMLLATLLGTVGAARSLRAARQDAHDGRH